MLNVTIGNNINRRTVLLPEDTTIREALEQNEIDYSVGMTSLDGSTLTPGQMDKTFAELGITDRCYLLNVVKADNAAVIKIVGGAVVVESAHELATLQKIQKFRGLEALTLYAGEGSAKKPMFGVCCAKSGHGKINANGAEFGTDATADGKAVITMTLPEGADGEKWAMENIGAAIINLNKVENKVEELAADVDREQATVRQSIQVL
ncbi:MAG: hypothetical protein IJV14_10735 [Lachnospiraceae bacterium]|nr:hypothetical protein [Lachnospiraceae bacterium]